MTADANNPPEAQSLAEAIAQSGIDLGAEVTPEQMELLDAYRHLLWDWNEKINLTRHTTYEKFVGRDLVDTLELSKHLERGDRVLDIGSGGGVPGLPLAILRPDLTVAVCDSVGKKARVLGAMVGELDLPVSVYPSRVEQVLEITTQGTLLARGVASLKKMLTWLAPHWEAFDRLLLIKGPAWVNERGEARHYGLLKNLELRRIAAYQSPLVGESYVLQVSPKGES